MIRTPSNSTRPNGQFAFHGGCHACTNDISICPGCQYMNADWEKPDLNPIHIEWENKKKEMIKIAYKEKAKKKVFDVAGYLKGLLN